MQATAHDTQGRCALELPSELDLVVFWGGSERSFMIAEMSADEVVVVGCFVDELDLRHREASIQFCDDELLDEVACRVVFRGFSSPGIARFRLLTSTGERLEVARVLDAMRARVALRRELQETCLAVACGWL